MEKVRGYIDTESFIHHGFSLILGSKHALSNLEILFR